MEPVKLLNERVMEIFSSLFGGKRKSSSGLSPEVSWIFEKLLKFMEDENFHNSLSDNDPYQAGT